MALLRDTRLRGRLKQDMFAIAHTGDLGRDVLYEMGLWRGDFVGLIADDALDCLTAALRGDEPPPRSDEVTQCLRLFDQERSELRAFWDGGGGPRTSSEASD
ncbi:hypothetical protein ACFV1A_16430 [Streptomyces seoulensis]|uniref:hypothetical protein n=1 Tax=Streptomyces seoulensis TaxID=73044 RepID=UPI0036D0B32C